MFQASRPVRAAALLMVLPAASRAHGPAPAALEVLRQQGGQAEVVRLNFGLAVRMSSDSEYFRYLCPGQWGEEAYVPTVGVLPEGGLIVPTRDRPHASDADACDFAGLNDPTWRDQTTLGVAGAEPLYILTRDDSGSSLWAFELGELPTPAFERVLHLPEVKLDSVAVDPAGDVVLLGARPEPRVYRLAGGETSFVALTLDEPPQFLAMRSQDPVAREHFLFIANVADGVRLLETRDGGVTVTTALRAAERLHGPISLGDALVALADGVWQVRRPADGTFQPAGEQPYTCLQNLDGLALACLNREMVRLEGEPTAPDVSPFFSLSALLGPGPGCPSDDETARRCAEQWLHFGAEAGLVRADAGPTAAEADAHIAPVEPDAVTEATEADAAPVPATTPHGAGSGCQMRSGASRSAAWALPWAMLLLRRRPPRRSLFPRGRRLN